MWLRWSGRCWEGDRCVCDGGEEVGGGLGGHAGGKGV